jgi:hypothetical protein
MDDGVEGEQVWMAYSCGAVLARQVSIEDGSVAEGA